MLLVLSGPVLKPGLRCLAVLHHLQITLRGQDASILMWNDITAPSSMYGPHDLTTTARIKEKPLILISRIRGCCFTQGSQTRR